MNLRVLVLLALIATATAASKLLIVVSSNPPKVVGRLGQSVTLPCDVTKAPTTPNVTWSDTAYSAASNSPAIIYRSLGDEHGYTLNRQHHNWRDYEVEGKGHALTINQLKTDDVGQYTCESVLPGGEQHNRSYYLAVHGALNCTGVVRLDEGEETSLHCKTTYSGFMPVLYWYKENAQLTSEDKFSLTGSAEGPEAAILNRLSVTHDDDNATYRCTLSLDKTLLDECSLVLNVRYPVRDVRLNPDRVSYHVGQQVRCEAKGNPAPNVSVEHFQPNTTQFTGIGVGFKAFTIPTEWLGLECSVRCRATGGLSGQSLDHLHSFVVTEKPAPSASDSWSPLLAASRTTFIIWTLLTSYALCV